MVCQRYFEEELTATKAADSEGVEKVKRRLMLELSNSDNAHPLPLQNLLGIVGNGERTLYDISAGQLKPMSNDYRGFGSNPEGDQSALSFLNRHLKTINLILTFDRELSQSNQQTMARIRFNLNLLRDYVRGVQYESIDREDIGPREEIRSFHDIDGIKSIVRADKRLYTGFEFTEEGIIVPTYYGDDGKAYNKGRIEKLETIRRNILSQHDRDLEKIKTLDNS